MKRLAVFLSIIICLILSVGCTGANSPSSLTLVCPDGAPAISAYALKDTKVNVTVYPSASATASIQKDIRNKSADVAILPVNLASKLCASGADYKMIGVLTHGNLYGVGKNVLDENGLKGKTVGVIQLNAVPGYTVKLMLEKMGLQYVENKEEKNADNVYLYQIPADATAVKTALDTSKADVCIVAQPMCDRLISAFSLIKSIDVQSLYGYFPQAVAVVKTSVLENRKSEVNEMIASLSGCDYTALNATDLVNWINLHVADGEVSSLAPQALTVSALEGSNILFSPAQNAKSAVQNYLTQLKRFDTELGTVAIAVGDTFFWSGV